MSAKQTERRFRRPSASPGKDGFARGQLPSKSFLAAKTPDDETLPLNRDTLKSASSFVPLAWHHLGLVLHSGCLADAFPNFRFSVNRLGRTVRRPKLSHDWCKFAEQALFGHRMVCSPRGPQKRGVTGTGGRSHAFMLCPRFPRLVPSVASPCVRARSGSIYTLNQS